MLALITDGNPARQRITCEVLMGFRLITLFTALFFMSSGAYAVPSFEPIREKTIADTGSEFYGFETIRLKSADGERTYRVTIATPKAEAPAEGYPVVYMLDGNAVVMDLNEELLKDLSSAGPPVIAAVGYETDRRFDVDARAYDYTPPAGDGAPFPDPISPKRNNGGAEKFYKLIEHTLKPLVNGKVKTDPERQYLWGHSYGGLYVLYVLFNHPESFSIYVSADPSIWWKGGDILNSEKAFAESADRPKGIKVFISKSGAERERTPQNEEHRKSIAERTAAVNSVPADAAETMAGRLNSLDGITAEFRAYPELNHAGLIPVSIDETLRRLAGLKD